MGEQHERIMPLECQKFNAEIQALLLGQIILISNLNLTCFLSNALTFLAAPRVAGDPSGVGEDLWPCSAASEAAESRAAPSVCVCVCPAHTDMLAVGPRLYPLLSPESSRENLFGSANLPFSPSQSQENQGSSGRSVEFQCFSGAAVGREEGSHRERLRTGLMRGNQPP